MKRVVSPFKVVEQWDLEIYTLILLWRYVRRGERKKKKKQNRNRETFVSEAADISKNLTYTQGGGTRRHRKRSHTTSLVVPWTTLSRSKLDDSSGLKGYCETTLPPDSLIFPNLPRFFFSFPPFPSWDRHVMPSRWFFFENKFVYVIDWTGDDNPLYNSAIFH